MAFPFRTVFHLNPQASTIRIGGLCEIHYFDDTSARTARLHTEQIAIPLTISTTPPHLICFSTIRSPLQTHCMQGGRKEYEGRLFFQSSFPLLRIKIANTALSYQIEPSFSLTFWLAPKSNKKGARKLKRTLAYAITISTASKSAER